MLSPSKRGQLKEKADARLAKGKLQPNSGSWWSAKGDWELAGYLLDSKSTDMPSFRLTMKIWDKIAKEAIVSRKEPAIALGLGRFDILTKQHEYEVIIREAPYVKMPDFPDGITEVNCVSGSTKSINLTEELLGGLFMKYAYVMVSFRDANIHLQVMTKDEFLNEVYGRK